MEKHVEKHLTPITKTPQMAQTVQQLKFQTILDIMLGVAVSLGETSNSITGLIGTLPYKGFFGGGGGGTGGDGTGGDGDGDGTGGDGDGDAGA